MVKEELHIRRANIGDARLLSQLSSDTFFDTFNGTCGEDDMQLFIQQHFNEDQLKQELKDENDFYFIAFRNENAIGYMRLKEDVSDVEIIAKHLAVELKRIYVLKEFHSKKIGASLMNFAIDFASENDYEILWLGVWEHNETAKNFYRKFGFEDSGKTHPFPIGNTPQTDNWLYRFIRKT